MQEPHKRGAVAGDAVDFDDLLGSAFRYAMALTHNVADAQDLVQDASMFLLARRGIWTRPYLFATIRNRFIDLYRRSQRVPMVALDPDPESGENGHWNEATDSSLEGSDIFESVLLDSALARLRAEERETLFLSVVEGYTAQEIADLQGRPRGTVLSLLFRARQKLRAMLTVRADVKVCSAG